MKGLSKVTGFAGYVDESKRPKVKLVRDLIPELIKAEGREPDVHVATSAEYRRLLRTKLIEEVEEFLESDKPEELADVLEVVHALATDLGIDPSRLDAIRNVKALERGGFTRRLVLHM